MAKRLGYRVRLLRIMLKFMVRYSPARGLRVFKALYGSRDLYRPGARLPLELPGRAAAARVLVRGATTDTEVFREIFVDREFDLPWKIDPRFIIDGGAYAGYSSIFFATEYPRARVAAIEADPANFAMLEENVRDFPSIEVRHAAIYASDGFIEMANPVAEEWAARVEAVAREGEAGEARRVPSVTVGKLLAESGKERIDLIKMDIEGAEYDIFASGDLAWLERTAVLMIECHDKIRPGCSDLVRKEMEARGFRSVRTKHHTIFHKR